MFIQSKKVKGNVYFYLVKSMREGDSILKEYEICLGNKKRVDYLFEQYLEVRI